MAATTTQTQIDAWAAIALAAIREGATDDISTVYGATYHIDAALGGTTAHLGLKVTIQGRSNASAVDDDWHTLQEYVLLVGTAIKVDLGGDEAAGQTILTVTDPVTNNLDQQGKEVFMLDGGDVTISEIVYQTANSGDAGDTITVLDPTTHEHHATDTDFYTIDTANVSAVAHINYVPPPGVGFVRVLCNNNYGATGSTCYTRTRVSKVTAIA